MLVFLTQKEDGSDRAIALVPEILRLWGSMRRAPLREWSDAESWFWDTAVRNSSSLRVAMARAFRIECHVSLGYDVGISLVDVARFFDSMQLLRVFREALGRVFPVRIVLLAFAAYLSPWHLRWDGWLSHPIHPGQSILAGETSRALMAKACLFDVLNWFHFQYAFLQCTQWNDDLVIYAVSTAAFLLAELLPALVRLASQIEGIGLKVASKSGSVSSTSRLTRDFQTETLRLGLEMKAMDAAADLGIDQTCTRQAKRP